MNDDTSWWCCVWSGDRLPCGTQQRIRLEPPLGQPPVLTNILINTILIMSLISLKPCTIISLMSSPTIRHTRISPVEHSFPYYEPPPTQNHTIKGKGHKMTCGAYSEAVTMRGAALGGGIAARPSLPCQVVSGGHSAVHSS